MSVLGGMVVSQGDGNQPPSPASGEPMALTYLDRLVDTRCKCGRIVRIDTRGNKIEVTWKDGMVGGVVTASRIKILLLFWNPSSSDA